MLRGIGKKINVLIIVFHIKKAYSINEVARMFRTKIIYLRPRLGERYASSLTNMSKNKNNHIIRKFGKINLKDYITSFIKDKNL